jgi:hypothetical protein
MDIYYFKVIIIIFIAIYQLLNLTNLEAYHFPVSISKNDINFIIFFYLFFLFFSKHIQKLKFFFS